MSTKDTRETELGHLFENRKMLVTAQHELRKGLDNAILTVSSVALGLSLTVVKDINPKPIELGYLVMSWCMFGLCILATMLSIWLSWKSMQWKERLTLFQYSRLLRMETYADSQLEVFRIKTSGFTLAAGLTQALAAFTFTWGIMAVIIFTLSNLPKEV